VLVTEGYMDVVALAQLGFPNAVATLGTACTTDHVQKLFRFTDSVVFSFDGDAAGRRAARKALDGALPYASDVRSVKFLFLPAEHDPDSYIREFGKEAFARCVSEAIPLSRFLIDAAREDCDLHTAEGRAHLASNARPLWQLLPEGALKLQLLGEIAELVQLSSRELSALWAPRPTSKASGGQGSASPSGAYAGTGSRSTAYPAKRSPALGRLPPSSRADHAARLLLSDCALWERLTSEEHALLCGLPQPHGPLFSWLESQWHEHGPLPWAALREGLRDHASEPLARQLMSVADLSAPDAPAHEAPVELRNVIDRMLIEHLKTLETEAIAASTSDPQAIERYRALQTRRRELEASAQARSAAKTPDRV
jgi:DNA primase